MTEETTSIPLLTRGKQQPKILASREDKTQPENFFSLFRCSTRRDLWMTAGGVLLCVASSPFLPIILVAYAELVNMLVDRQYPSANSSSTEVHLINYFGGGVVLENATREVRMAALVDDAWAHAYVYASTNIVLLVLLALGVALVKLSAAHQAQRIRKQVFESVLRHDMTWFDINGGRSFASKINEELAKLEEGIGNSLGIFAHFLGNITIGFGVSLFLSWKLSLVVGSILPVNIALCIIIPKLQNSLAAKETAHAEKAGTIVNEALTNIRTVIAFGGEDKEVSKYSVELKKSSKFAVRRAMSTGLSTGATWVLNLLSMSLSFIYGTKILSNEQPIYNIIAVMALVWICAMRFSWAFRLLDSFISAKAAGTSIFKTVDAPHGIDPMSDNGNDLSEMAGKIELSNVSFSYAAREGVSVLKKVNMCVNPGESIAIVGPSGSGKTTVLQLIQRFYDCDEGEILIDNCSLQSLNVKWWRDQIGEVGQEASLFSGTISQNIRYGCLSASQTDVIKAAKLANAHNFITKLDKGYNTVIGSKGGTLSGGEKQRIAIARALVRRPKILLLDEPTSALDAESRDIVQAALEEASKGRMSVLVTHRLSNLQNIDRIYVVDCGEVAEEGSYEELIAKNGLFCKLQAIEQEMTKTATAHSNHSISKLGNGDGHIGEHTEQKLANILSVTKLDGLTQEKLPSKEGVEKGKEVAEGNFLKALLEWNRPQLPLIFVGFFMAACTGVCMPLFSIVYGKLAGSFQESSVGLIQEAASRYTLYLVGILAAMFVSLCSTIMAFSMAGERITSRIQIQSFKSILHKELGWFDDVNNHVGALCLRLADDAKAINNVTGTGVAMMLQAIVNMVVGISFSFYYSWQLTLASLPSLPFLFFGPFFEGYLNYKEENTENTPLEDASRIAVEAVENKRVVTSLGLEEHFIEKYSEALDKTCTHWRKKAMVRGFAVAFGNVIPHLGYTVSLGYGCYLMGRDNMPYEDVIKVGELLVLGGIMLATEFVFSPIISNAKVALVRLRILLKDKSSVSGGTMQVIPPETDGAKIQYSKVSLAYPARPESLVLDNVDLSILNGQHIGLVGPSGSGKSTILHLLQRLYDPTSGRVHLNSVDIQNFTLPTLRSHLGLVSQEPVLFSGTIRDNISYGDNTKEVAMSDIVEAATAANIHTFISSLPSGYETELGAITQLSGGQKQRIAIARALVRNPKVLLLDEATSALDPESEKVVQKALNKASESRTTITVAHRLGAVGHADVIMTLEGGRIVDTRIANAS